MSVTNLQPARKLRAARTIAKALPPSEDAIDVSIIQNANLLISIVQGRMDGGFAAEVGHDAYLSAFAGMASLSQARSHVIDCHRKLAVTRDEQGYSGEDVGCTVTKVGGRADAAPAVMKDAVAA